MAFAKLNSMKFVGLDGLSHFWSKAKTWIINRITTEVTAKIAEIVANAPEDLDTLKEISDWISTHADSAASMNTQISANTSNISTNTSDIATLKTTVAVKSDVGHTHTKSDITDFPTSLPANGGTANSAKIIFPNYITKALTTVSTARIKYIKIATCTYTNEGTLKVSFQGNNFDDRLIINFGGGNATTPTLCGHYYGNSRNVLSVIAQKGSSWSSNYSIYIKVHQLITLSVSVAILTGSCTIDISESTTAPTNISEWDISYGLFGNLTGNATTATTATTATKTSLLDEYVGAGGTRLTSGNIIPKDATEYGGMRKDVVTTSMTDSGRPNMDGHLLTMFWDNSGRYDSQFFIKNGATPELKVRGKDNQTDYSSWTDVITSNNIGSQTVAKATNATNATNDSNGNNIANTYMPKSGGTFSGSVTFDRNVTLDGMLQGTDPNSSINFTPGDVEISAAIDIFLSTPNGTVYVANGLTIDNPDEVWINSIYGIKRLDSYIKNVVADSSVPK